MIRLPVLLGLAFLAGTCGGAEAPPAVEAPAATAVRAAAPAADPAAAAETAARPVPLAPAASAPGGEAAPAGEATRPGVETIGRDLVARSIGPGAWVITHLKPLPANSLVVEAPGELLLVDTPWTPSATRELLAWIEKRFGPRRKSAVTTHFHLDALGGNAALREAGIGPRGLVTTEALLRRRGPQRRDELLADLAADHPQRRELAELPLLAPPSQYMAGVFTLPLGDETYQLIHPGPSHSPDLVAVYLPGRRLLFGGCAVKGGDSLGFTGDADLGGWVRALRELQQLGAEVVVPGHGDRLDPGQLAHTLELLRKAGATGDEAPVAVPEAEE